MRGFLTGDNPKMNDELLRNDLLENLDILESKNTELLMAIVHSGYSPESGIKILETETKEQSIQRLIHAVIEHSQLNQKIQASYNQTIRTTVELAKKARTDSFEDALFNVAIESASYISNKAEEKSGHLKQQIKALEKTGLNELKRKAGCMKGVVYLNSLYIEVIKELAENVPDKLNENVHKTGVFTEVLANVIGMLEADNFNEYTLYANVFETPSMPTHKRRFKDSLELLGFPPKRTTKNKK